MPYEPHICPNKSCMGYGDSVPVDQGRCFLCWTPVVRYTEIPYEELYPFVRFVLERQVSASAPE